MENVVRWCWLSLAAVRVLPAAAVFRPALVQTLYGVDPGDAAGVLLVHRGALFLGIVTLCLFAMLRPEARQAASVTVLISMAGFLIVYTAAGMPAGALRTVAIVDTVASLPLALVFQAAWWGRPA
jgi:hypothetical protein